MTWHLETEYRGDDETIWRLLEADESGALTIRGVFMEESWAKRFMSAIQWQDALGSGVMRLAQDGVVIDANTGKVWTPPKRRRTPALKIEPTKRRKA